MPGTPDPNHTPTLQEMQDPNSPYYHPLQPGEVWTADGRISTVDSRAAGGQGSFLGTVNGAAGLAPPLGVPDDNLNSDPDAFYRPDDPQAEADRALKIGSFRGTGVPSQEDFAARRLGNHYEYGGTAGKAAEDAAYFRRLAEAAQGRTGEKIDYSDAKDWEGNTVKDRVAQLSVADMMKKRAMGLTPSIAEMRANIDTNKAVADQTSIAAGARGPAGLAIANQVAAANSANTISTISNNAQVNAAQERLEAEKAAFGAYSGVRGGDVQSQEQAAKQAQTQAALNADQRRANDAYSSGLYGNETGVNKAQLDAQMHQIDTAAGVQTADKNRSSAESMHSDDRTDKYIAIAGGAAATAGGIVLANALGGSPAKNDPSAGGTGGSAPGAGGYNGNAPADGSLTPGTSGGSYGQGTYGDGTPKPLADGGPMRAGQTYLVGERGPELVVPEHDGQVIPAEHPLSRAAVRDLGEIDEPVRDLGEIDEPARDFGEVDSPRFAPKRMPGPNARNEGEIDTIRQPISFERHNSPAMDRAIADLNSTREAQRTLLGEPSTARAIERSNRHPLADSAQPNRVDAMLDNIHPLSYHYKSPDAEPRSKPTGGRYLGISAQDLEAVPEVGHQMVSEGPRGKQIEMGPTLSAAMAGVARLNERLRAVEGHPSINRTNETRALRNESLRKWGEHSEENYNPHGPMPEPMRGSGMSEEQEEHNDPTVWDEDDVEARNDRRSPTLAMMTSDMRAKSNVMSEGASAGASVANSMTGGRPPTTDTLTGGSGSGDSMSGGSPMGLARRSPTAPSWGAGQLPGPQRALPGPQFPRPQLPGPQQPATLASLPGPQLPGPQKSLYGGGAALPGPQSQMIPQEPTRAQWGSGQLPGPQRSAYSFTSDMKAKEDVVSEGMSGPRGRVAESGGRASGQQPVAKASREHPLAAAVPLPSSGFADTTAAMAAAPPIPGAVPGMLDGAKTIAALGQSASTSADGYQAAAQRMSPALLAAKRRTEAALDEAALRARDTYRAVTGNAQRAPTLANVDQNGGRR